jgi:hypothetical protein
MGIKFEDGGGQQVRGGMAEDLHRVRILGGENRKFGIAIERAREVDEFAIGARDKSFLRKARRNLRGNLRGSGAARKFASSAVRQCDLNRVHI